MKIFWTLFLAHLLLTTAQAQCPQAIDLLVVGDSQIGATWSRSYLGNFLQTCLKGDFAIYARGGTVPGNWLDAGGMDHIETIERTALQSHLNIGANENVPLCKKRIGPMLEAHIPKKVLFEFGGNYISTSETVIKNQINRLMETVEENKINPQDCYFLTPTYEMVVESRRNVPTRNMANVKVVRDIIEKTIASRCQIVDGMEVMKDSTYFDGKELLKRVQIEGKSGCAGAAANDNVHTCGAAAKDYAERICQIINH